MTSPHRQWRPRKHGKKIQERIGDDKIVNRRQYQHTCSGKGNPFSIFHNLEDTYRIGNLPSNQEASLFHSSQTNWFNPFTTNSLSPFNNAQVRGTQLVTNNKQGTSKTQGICVKQSLNDEKEKRNIKKEEMKQPSFEFFSSCHSREHKARNKKLTEYSEFQNVCETSQIQMQILELSANSENYERIQSSKLEVAEKKKQLQKINSDIRLLEGRKDQIQQQRQWLQLEFTLEKSIQNLGSWSNYHTINKIQSLQQYQTLSAEILSNQGRKNLGNSITEHTDNFNKVRQSLKLRENNIKKQTELVNQALIQLKRQINQLESGLSSNYLKIAPSSKSPQERRLEEEAKKLQEEWQEILRRKQLDG